MHEIKRWGTKKTWGSQRWVRLFRSFNTTPFHFGCNDACHVPVTLSCTSEGSAVVFVSNYSSYLSWRSQGAPLIASARRVPSGVYVCTKHTWAWESGYLQSSGRLALSIVSDFIAGLVCGGKKGPFSICSSCLDIQSFYQAFSQPVQGLRNLL